jgi:Cof subfamily protein (haloacid dehalogenase superfamily)
VTQLLIATDLDGTIVRTDGSISARTVAAFEGALERGARMIFATGRPPRWMGDVMDAFGGGLAICGNGALIYDLDEGRILEQKLFNEVEARHVIQLLRDALPEVHFAIERIPGFRREINYQPNFDMGIDLNPVEQIEEVLDEPMIKLLARCMPDVISSDEMSAIVTPLVAGLVEVTHFDPTEAVLELTAPGATKGHALAKIAADWGFDQGDVVAFGDNPNDLSMLAWAGRSYAMANAHPLCIEAAKHLAPHVDDDGVAAVLEEIFGL